LSSTEAEYVAHTLAVKESIWFNQLLTELGRAKGKTIIYCDNKSNICMTKNPEYHQRTKHIDIKYHFIREVVNNEAIKVEHIPTDIMPA
jgi:hypothetical protein